MLTITTNIQSLISQRSLSKSTQLLNQAIERMSTGYKLNHASDNAANYSISTNMRVKLSSYQIAEDNAAMGLDMLTTANDSLNLISDHLVRIRALAEQAANGTYGAQSLKAINSEVNARVDEIERLYSTAEYNGMDLFNCEVEKSNFLKDIVRRDTSNMTKLSEVNEEITSGTYSISTAEELAKLAEMTNNGLIKGGEFVLANDIDLSSISNWTTIGNEHSPFAANFDGNGYCISNLTINNDKSHQGLFGVALHSEITNLGVKDCDINVSPINANAAGVIVGVLLRSTLSNCYSTGKINGCYSVGGLAGAISMEGYIYDSYTDLELLSGTFSIGTIIGDNYPNSKAIIKNCFALNPQNSDKSIYGANYAQLEVIASLSKEVEGKLVNSHAINYQVGVTGTLSSEIVCEIGNLLINVENLRNIGIDSKLDYLNNIDRTLESISTKQVEYGSAQNRLESALDEISTQYENILSSRSTLKDADIAKVSSQYIQQQILQQASATLISTANQTPALALQLL